MLTATAVVAVVSGALSFKAHTFNGNLYCSTVSGTSGVCCTKYSANFSGTNLYCTTVNWGTCATTLTKVVPDAK